jgi:hypothetical protein
MKLLFFSNQYYMAGLDEWKKDPKSDEYDWELVQNRLNQLRIVRDQANPSTMIFQLRTSLARNLGDMDKSQVSPLLGITDQK